jgi:AbrB family looped-hinge helix DNA binding protein
MPHMDQPDMPPTQPIVTTICDGGRLLIPAVLRRRLGLGPGTAVVLDVADGALQVRPLAQAIAHAQALVRRHVPPEVSLAEELIRERHQAAARC